MTYELNKKLKDAGFQVPEHSRGEWLRPVLDGSSVKWALVGWVDHALETLEKRDVSAWIYIPTLSELIEACGNKFACLTLNHVSKNWWADGIDPDEKGCIPGIGSTPEEAVAKLWLALNKSD